MENEELNINDIDIMNDDENVINDKITRENFEKETGLPIYVYDMFSYVGFSMDDIDVMQSNKKKYLLIYDDGSPIFNISYHEDNLVDFYKKVFKISDNKNNSIINSMIEKDFIDVKKFNATELAALKNKYSEQLAKHPNTKLMEISKFKIKEIINQTENKKSERKNVR